MSTKPYRIRIRVLDGKPRDPKKLKGQVPHVDFVDVKDKVEFVVCAVKEAHLEQVRAMLGAAGLEEVIGGDTNITAPPTPVREQPSRNGGLHPRGGPQQRGGPQWQQRQPAPTTQNEPLPKKPYGFVALPKDLTTATPIWHDGASSNGRLSGEVRFELETLTPLLVGWERCQVGEDNDAPWPVEHIDGVKIGEIKGKSVLCPLRAPWGNRPVIIPGDSLKGLLRHELGALLGAPMERVAERSYSYRPNAMFAQEAQLVPRIAHVPNDGVEMKALDDKNQVRVPTKLELLPMSLRYDKKCERNANYYRFDDGNGATYRGGQGAGEKLNSKRKLHKKLTANPSQPTETVTLSQAVQDGYLATVRHFVDLDHGHFSERHPDVPNTVTGDATRSRILKAAKEEVFQPGDLIWVEWDAKKRCIVSFGWHYYYRWAYTDSVRQRGSKREPRHGLFPLDEERAHDDKDKDAPRPLSLVRRLFGYTGDNDGSKGIGKGDYAQLMGRVFVNAGLEVVGENETDDNRFLKPTFLKELGMPRPSAVEHYLKQNVDAQGRPQKRPSDNATLVTYGDAIGYDESGELAGRKFYLDRPNAVAEDASDTNRQNDRSTLAIEASQPGRKFRFTVRFRDLDSAEVAAICIALCPHQFQDVLTGQHKDGYCSKLGYARPLGWGSVRIEGKSFLLLDEAGDGPTLKPEADLATLAAWVKSNHQKTATQDEWLAIHQRHHPNAADYPCKDGQIYNVSHELARGALAQPSLYERRRSMTSLLVMTAGQSDVQLVVDKQRHKFDGNTCGTLHNGIKERSWSVVNVPSTRSRDLIKILPEGELKLCTPKLDAVLAHFGDALPTSALILETNRQDARDPWMSGEIMERRLRDLGVSQVTPIAFLRGTEQLEDPSNDVDAVVRRSVVATLSNAIGVATANLTPDDRVFVATTGGLAAANELINELVRLHAVGGPVVTALKVPDVNRTEQDDRVVEEKFHPAAGYRARWHALSLIEKGNLLGAWGAVKHLEGAPGQQWTETIKWLAHFASSLPLPTGCELAVLSHQRMAVRTAIRVELALRAGDIPRAVHGTVAFLEAALWDHLGKCATPNPDTKKRRWYTLNPIPPNELVGSKCPFRKKVVDGKDQYWIEERQDYVVQIAKHYLVRPSLTKLAKVVSEDVRDLRHDVAHNEPTPDLMENARRLMQQAKLWSEGNGVLTFLTQPLVQNVLRELGESQPESLCDNLLREVRKRLVEFHFR